MKFIDIVKEHIGPPVDVDAIVAKIPNLDLDNSVELDDRISGQLERIDGKRFRISVNGTHAEVRRRFTLAHELGHFLLHRELLGDGVDDNKAFRSDLEIGNFKNANIKKSHEVEANRFAAQLLMPKKILIENTKTCSSIEELASKFGVSTHAMAIRLSGLGFGLNDSDPQFATIIKRSPVEA